MVYYVKLGLLFGGDKWDLPNKANINMEPKLHSKTLFTKQVTHYSSVANSGNEWSMGWLQLK